MKSIDVRMRLVGAKDEKIVVLVKGYLNFGMNLSSNADGNQD